MYYEHAYPGLHGAYSMLYACIGLGQLDFSVQHPHFERGATPSYASHVQVELAGMDDAMSHLELERLLIYVLGGRAVYWPRE